MVFNVIAAFLYLIATIIDKSPPEVVGDIIAKHEARLDKAFAWIDKHIHNNGDDDSKKQ